jgi:hypothetical protein
MNATSLWALHFHVFLRGCSPMHMRQAEAVFALAPIQPDGGTSALESSCNYIRIVEGVSLTTHVTWDPRRLANFRNTANPLAVPHPGRTSSGATIPAAHWVHPTAVGEPALWLPPVPSTGPQSPADVSGLVGSRDGYVVMTQSTGLAEFQATRVLGFILNRL